MYKKLLLTTFASTVVVNNPVFAQDLLTGDQRLACEALLCLSSGSRPSECNPSIQRYFSIRHKKASATLNARRDFLNMCPASKQDNNMRSLVDAISRGAGNCDAASINIINRRTVWSGWDEDRKTYISSTMPSYCTAYYQHEYTDLKSAKPMYVGTPDRGGYWVEAEKYQEAYRQYKIRIDREDKAKAQQQQWWNQGGGN